MSYKNLFDAIPLTVYEKVQWKDDVMENMLDWLKVHWRDNEKVQM